MDGTFRGEQVPLVLPPMATEKNFSRYFPPSKEFQDCGCHVVSFGFESVGAGADYPLREHPRDHLFSDRRGRVLSSYVIEFLVSGEGLVESEASAPSAVRAGDVFLVFPEVRHRYRPKAEVGWSKWWMEMSGPVAERWMGAAGFDLSQPVLSQAGGPILQQIFQELAANTKHGQLIQPMIASSMALELIARARESVEKREPPDARVLAMLRAARREIREQTENPHIDWEALSLGLGVSYSSLRQTFSRMLGISPGQYHLFLRQRQAVALLKNSDLPITNISETLGFDSIYYFSRFIKQKTGNSPRAIRAAGGEPKAGFVRHPGDEDG